MSGLKRGRSPSPEAENLGLDESILNISCDEIPLSPADVATPESSPVRRNFEYDSEASIPFLSNCTSNQDDTEDLGISYEVLPADQEDSTTHSKRDISIDMSLASSMDTENPNISELHHDVSFSSVHFEEDCSPIKHQAVHSDAILRTKLGDHAIIERRGEAQSEFHGKAAQDPNVTLIDIEEFSESDDSLSEAEFDSNGEESDGAGVSEISVSDDDEIEHSLVGDPPVYEGAPITVSESMTAVLAYIMRHELSGKAILDLLNLINIHCREERNKMHTSLYLFKKYFSFLDCPVVYHYYCSSCYLQLGTKDDSCPQLSKHPKSAEKTVFVELPLIPQLQALFSQEEFFSTFNYNQKRSKMNLSNIEDIFDGQLYQELEQSGFFGPDSPCNFSAMINTDGVPVFHTTKTSLWPIFFNVLEKPPHERFLKQNTVIAGLWFGTKPSANLMLKPLLPSFQAISKGFMVKPFGSEAEVKAKGIVLAATTDLPAKVMLLGMASYSGSFGCQVCKIPGGSVKIVKKTKTKSKNQSSKKSEEEEVKTSSVWVYKFSDALELRSHQETIKFGQEAQKALVATKNPKTNISGVKFPSAIFKIMYDAIRGFAIDDLHTLYLGVTKTLINLWFDSKHHGQPFSIRKHISTVDQRLKDIKFPNFLERGVITIEGDLADWKGKDFLAWLHYLSILVLVGILPDKYLQHHIDLVSSLQLLQSSSIAPDALLACDKTLNNYVKDFEILYGTRHMSMVVHLLQHLVFVVNNLGPLKYLSCFPYESLNGEILKMIHGTRYIETQLASSSYLLQKLPHRLKSLKPDSDVKDFCDKILHPSKRLKILECIASDVFSVGTYDVLSKTSENYITGAIRKIMEVDDETVIESFLRLKKGKRLFLSRSYTRSTRTNSFTCSFLHNDSLSFGAIEIFVKLSVGEKTIFFAIIESARVNICSIATKPVNHVLEYSLTGELIPVPILNLQDMMVCVEVEGKSYICEPLDHSLKS